MTNETRQRLLDARLSCQAIGRHAALGCCDRTERDPELAIGKDFAYNTGNGLAIG